jgi:hypothetical protein
MDFFDVNATFGKAHFCPRQIDRRLPGPRVEDYLVARGPAELRLTSQLTSDDASFRHILSKGARSSSEMAMMKRLALPMPGIVLCRTMGSRSPISEANRFILSR